MCSGDSPEGHRMLLIIYASCHLLAMTSVCTNPVMYGFLNENFKQVHNWEIISSLNSGYHGYHPSKLYTSQRSNFKWHSQQKSYKMIIEETFPAVFQNLSSKPKSPWTKKWLPAESGKVTLNADFIQFTSCNGKLRYPSHCDYFDCKQQLFFVCKKDRVLTLIKIFLLLVKFACPNSGFQ